MTFGRADGWLPLSLAGAAGVTLVDAALMERRFGVFSGGFLAPEHLGTFTQRASFVVTSGLSDLVVVGTLTGLTLWLASWCGLSAVPRRFLALVVGVGPLALADLFSYQLMSYLGDTFDLSLMYDLVGRQPREFIAVAAAHLTKPLWLIGVAAGALLAIVWLLEKRFRDAAPAGRRGPSAAILLLVMVVGIVSVTAGAASSEPMHQALGRKPSAQAIAISVNAITDVDRDGYGVGSRPADADPFSAKIHPYAVDLPGDGIDEDGIAGDLPVALAEYHEGPSIAPSFAWRPDVVFVLLESVRADVLDAEVNGHPATPVLRALAQAGGSAPHSYSHNGFTYQSRYHLFSGSLAGLRGGTTLVDDFKANGYRVGYFSGQDDTFGGPELQVDFDRADVSFDARSAPGRRYTQFSTAGSLAVPASVVLEQASAFIGTTTAATPMFVYVNFHDTHFPYHYAAIEPLLSRTVLNQSSIVPGRAVELREMYLNTVANVDRAIGALVDEVTRVRGRAPAVIVTSDHGESLFDEGFLGHGYALNEAQTRVPFVAARLPLTLPQPFAQVDLRQAIWTALAAVPGSDPRPDFSQTSPSPVFQYLGSIEAPRQIGTLSLQGRTVYDFRSDRVLPPDGRWQRPTALAAAGRVGFLDLVHRWERMMLARSRVHPTVLE